MGDRPERRSRNQRIRVLIADDHPMYQEGVVRVLSGYPEFELVARVGTARAALSEIRRLSPDVALVDLQLPDLDGIAVVEQLEREAAATKVAIVSAYEDSATVYRAISAGARAYLSKVSDAGTLRDTIHAVARGETVIPPSMQTGLAREIRARRTVEDAPVLTAREIEILRHIADGLSAPEVA